MESQRMIFKASLLLISMLPLFTLAQQLSNTTKSYLTNESFTLYPPWIVQASNRGSIRFSFRTSQQNGLLLYMDGDAFGDDIPSLVQYFKLSVVNGTLAVETFDFGTFNPDITIIREHVNDGQAHTVLIGHQRNTDTGSLTIMLDSHITTLTLTYQLYSNEDIGASGLYIAGVNGHQSLMDRANTDIHFVGCIMDLRYSNDSFQDNDLLPQAPMVEEESVVEQCVDPCEGVNCGGGVCVGTFPVGTCDCRNTGLLGPDCTEEPSTHSRTFTSDGPYLCYDIALEPYTGEQRGISLTLTPPFPLTGTVFTGVSSNGLFYEISIENGRIVNRLSQDGVAVASVKLTTFIVSMLSDIRIEANVSRTFLLISVTAVSEPNETETMEAQFLLTYDPVFEHVCLGGVLLESPNYVGTIESAYFDFLSLTEERNFGLLGAVQTERLNLINYNGDALLTFQHLHTNAVRFSFDKRTAEDTNIFRLTNANSDTLRLSSVEESLFSLPDLIQCNHPVNDDRWHHFEVEITREPSPKISYTIDCVTQCNMSINLSHSELEGFLSNPLEFAIPHPVIGGPTDPFNGCLQNFVFEQSDGELIRPNLEALTRIGSNFLASSTGCDHCIDRSSSECPDTCMHRDFMRENECPPYAITSVFQCPPLANSTTTTMSNPTISQTTPTFPPMSNPTISQTTPTFRPLTGTDLGTWVGIGIGIFLAILLLVLIFILLFVLFFKHRAGQGFYKTYETNEKHPQVIHYSASLRELSSEVILTDSNGQLPSAVSTPEHNGQNGLSREFYL